MIIFLWSDALFGSLDCDYTPPPFVQVSPMFIHVLKEICASVGYYWSSITCEILRMRKRRFDICWHECMNTQNILILHMVKKPCNFFKNLNRLYTNFIHNEKTIPCISKSKTYHVGNMKGNNESFSLLGKGDYDWPTKVHYCPLVFFRGEKLPISALWAQSFEPLVLFQRDFSLGKSCPFWHYFAPHLLNHWLFFKEIFPWGKVVHLGTTLGPIFWATLIRKVQ